MEILESYSVNYILNIGKLRKKRGEGKPENDKDSLTLTQLSRVGGKKWERRKNYMLGLSFPFHSISVCIRNYKPRGDEKHTSAIHTHGKVCHQTLSLKKNLETKFKSSEV